MLGITPHATTTVNNNRKFIQVDSEANCWMMFDKVRTVNFLKVVDHIQLDGLARLERWLTKVRAGRTAESIAESTLNTAVT